MHTNGREYNFNKFTLLKQFYYDILSGKVTIRQARDEKNIRFGAFEEGVFSMPKEVLHKNETEKQAEKQAEEKEKKR